MSFEDAIMSFENVIIQIWYKEVSSNSQNYFEASIYTWENMFTII